MNRQKAANALRGYAETHGRYDPFWCVKDAVFGDVQAHPVGEVLSTLADLIDPTCRPEPCAREDNGGVRMLRCPECGLACSEGFWAMPDVRFCPRCGSRVKVGGEE